MRVATVDGLVTFFYDGSRELYNVMLEKEMRDALQSDIDDSDSDSHNERSHIEDENASNEDGILEVSDEPKYN